MHIWRCMGSKSCVKFQMCPLKFHTKFWTHTPQNMHFTDCYFSLWFAISCNCDVISLSETGPWLSFSHCGMHIQQPVIQSILHHILLLVAHTFRENREFVFIIIVQFMMSANNRIRFVVKIVFVSLYITPSHYHKNIVRHIIIVQTYLKALNL